MIAYHPKEKALLFSSRLWRIKVLGAVLAVSSLLMCPDKEWDRGEVNIPAALLLVLADAVLLCFTLTKPWKSCPQQCLSLGCGVEYFPQAGELGQQEFSGTPVEAISQCLFYGRQPQPWENTSAGVTSCCNAHLSGWQHWSVQRFKLFWIHFQGVTRKTKKISSFPV